MTPVLSVVIGGNVILPHFLVLVQLPSCSLGHLVRSPYTRVWAEKYCRGFVKFTKEVTKTVSRLRAFTRSPSSINERWKEYVNHVI